MAENKSVLLSFINAYNIASSAVIKDRRVYMPFVIFALMELFSLLFFYLAPRVPLRSFMGPFITALWGEQFLHYPQNFFLLPKLASLSRMVLSVLVGSLLTGLAVAYLYKKPASEAFKKYVHLMIIICLLTIIFYFANKVMYKLLVKYFSAGHHKLLFMSPAIWLGPINIFFNQFFALILQAIFVYAIPVIMMTEKKFFGAIIESFMFFIKNFGLTLLLVGLPMLLSVPVLLLNYNGAYFMNIFSPEFILWMGFLGIIVNSLMIDPLITLTAASCYAENRGK